MDGTTHTSAIPSADVAQDVAACETAAPGLSGRRGICAHIHEVAPRRPVPAVLDRDQFDRALRAFIAEHSPVGPTELALVRDLARQATAMERWGVAAESVQRQAARTLPQLANCLPQDDQEYADAVLSGAMATESADRFERHSLARSRAFTRTLEKLEAQQARRKSQQESVAIAIPAPFVDEAACMKYLELRQRNQNYRCAKCSHIRGCYLPSRRAWECGRCRAQAGLRTGTVMAGSGLKIAIWFEAIRWLLWRPTIGVTELCQRIGVRRPTTVRNMARRIREAMAADDATDQLAGLDRYFVDENVT